MVVSGQPWTLYTRVPIKEEAAWMRTADLPAYNLVAIPNALVLCGSRISGNNYSSLK
jgi:hypothetical protein